ncbi:MAG: DNA repair protein RecO [Gemmataceae bacterium]|nr:DNA repair protein RecO [Gemmataceae bacterium]
MPAEAATGLVVRASDWSETSRIVTLFTREWGKIRALAKGGRRLRSNFEIALDLLTVCRVMVIRKGQGGLDLLTEARLEQRFAILRKSLAALYVGYYLAELLAEGTQDYDPHPALYDTAISTLESLEAGRNPALSATEFELAWLREVGYSPRLDACAVCGGPVEGEDVVWTPAAGGVVCPQCRSRVLEGVRLSPSSWLWLQRLSHGEALPASLPPPGDVRQALGLAVTQVLGRRPKMLRYLDGQ